MQIVITRENVTIPWGFRLKGGAEYNVPLSILKVNDGSPSYRKLEVGDVIASIGSYPALNLNHEDALNIIRQFDLNLPLVIQREQSQFSGYQNTTPKFTAKSSAVWRPPSVSSYDLGSNVTGNSSSNSFYQPSNSLIGTLPVSARNNSSSFYNDQNQAQQTKHQFQNQMYPPQHAVQVASTHSTSAYNQYNHAPISPQQNVQSPSYNSLQSTNNYFNSGYEAQNYSQPLLIQPIQASPPVPPPPPPAYIPPPPPPMNSVSSSQQNRSWNVSADLKPTSTSYERKNETTSNFKSTETISNAVPDALLKSMHGSGKKPFTYTPGGLDLSHVKNSLRVKRHEQQSSTHQFQQQQHKPQQNFSNYSGQQTQQNFSNQSNFNPSSYSNSNSSYKGPISNFGGGSDDETQYSSPVSFSSSSHPPFVPQPPVHQPVVHQPVVHQPVVHQPSYQSHAPAPIRLNSTSSSTPMGASTYKPINFDSVPSTPKAARTPITYQPSKSQAPSVIYQGSAVNITPDQLTRPKGEDKRELMNQSFSFRMLNKWIEDSESKIVPMKSKKDEEDEREKEKEKTTIKKSEVIKALEEEEIKNKSFNSPSTLRHASSTSQLKSVSINPAHTVPSKVFQYVDRKYSITEDETNQATYVSNRKQSFSEEQYQRAPARERTQENAPPKYKGAHIPSKAFSYLQYLTQNETTVSSTYNNNSANSISNQLPASQINAPSNLEFASLQVFEKQTGFENNNFKLNANNNASFPNLNSDLNHQAENVEVISDSYEKIESDIGEKKNCEISTVCETKINGDVNDTIIEPEQSLTVTNQNFESGLVNKDQNELDNSLITILPKSASFVEILPAKETEPCFNEPNIALSFSNNEIINESVDFNDIKEASRVNGIETSKTVESDFKTTRESDPINNSTVFENKEDIAKDLANEKINNDNSEELKSNENENQVSTNAQEIETSEF